MNFKIPQDTILHYKKSYRPALLFLQKEVETSGTAGHSSGSVGRSYELRQLPGRKLFS
jgi:hypothetical protein